MASWKSWVTISRCSAVSDRTHPQADQLVDDRDRGAGRRQRGAGLPARRRRWRPGNPGSRSRAVRRYQIGRIRKPISWSMIVIAVLVAVSAALVYRRDGADGVLEILGHDLALFGGIRSDASASRSVGR